MERRTLSIQNAAMKSGLMERAEKIIMGPVGIALAAGVGVAAVVSAGGSMAERYSAYNPIIAQQTALAEIRTTLGDLRRAREGQKELADLVRAQNTLYNHWEDLKLKVMKMVIPLLVGLLEMLNNMFNFVSKTEDIGRDDDPTSVIHREGFMETRTSGN